MENPIIKVEHLYHRYATQWAVEDISFEIRRHGLICLLGSNGDDGDLEVPAVVEGDDGTGSGDVAGEDSAVGVQDDVVVEGDGSGSGRVVSGVVDEDNESGGRVLSGCEGDVAHVHVAEDPDAVGDGR